MPQTTPRLTHPTYTSPLLITFAYYLAFIGIGLVTASLGPTLPALANQTQASLSQISYLFTARSLGFLLGSFLIGRAYDRVAGHPIMIAMLFVVAGMLTLVPLTSLLWSLILVMLLIGIGLGSIDVGGNTLLVWVYQNRVGPYMNGLHFVWGIGAFLSPILIAQVVQSEADIRWAYWLLAMLLLPITVGLLRSSSPQSIHTKTDTSFIQAKPIWLVPLTILFFLYVGAEVSLSGWVFTYTIDLGLADKIHAAYLNSAFFGSLTLARLLAIPVAARFRPNQILFADLVICLISAVVMMIFPTSLVALWAGTIGLGIGMGSMFPTLLDLAQDHMTITGSITGWFFLGASSAGMSLPWLIGQFFETIGPHIMIVAILTCLSLAMIVFATLIFMQKSFAYR